MPQHIQKIRTSTGDFQIDHDALANSPEFGALALKDAITKSDLETNVQLSLEKADSALPNTINIRSGEGENSVVSGDDVSAIGECAIATGCETIAGCMGYYYDAVYFDTTNKTVTFCLCKDQVADSTEVETLTSLDNVDGTDRPSCEWVTSVVVNEETGATTPFYVSYANNDKQYGFEFEIDSERPYLVTIKSKNNNIPFSAISTLAADEMTIDDFAIFSMEQPEIGASPMKDFSHSEGWGSVATGAGAHAEGTSSRAFGDYSHAEGWNGTTAYHHGAHAEGRATKAYGNSSHVEGNKTEAHNHYGHAEGDQTISKSNASHAEGVKTRAMGTGAHAEGGAISNSAEIISWTDDVSHSGQTISGSTEETNASDRKKTDHTRVLKGASASYSHTEGYNTSAIGAQSHAEGLGSISRGNGAHAEGQYTQAVSSGAHAEGYNTLAKGEYSHAEGKGTEALVKNSHAEGEGSRAYSYWAHAEGRNTIAGNMDKEDAGRGAHAEGISTAALKAGSHAEGYGTVADGDYAHAEGSVGKQTIVVSWVTAEDKVPMSEDFVENVINSATGRGSHSEGVGTRATGLGAHSEGGTDIKTSVDCGVTDNPLYDEEQVGPANIASGNYSHTEGLNTRATATAAHAEGNCTIATGEAAHAEGKRSSYSATTITWEDDVSFAGYVNGDSTETSAYGKFTHTRPLAGSEGECSHTEGLDNTAKGKGAHAEGGYSIARGAYSHAEGYQTQADGAAAHAEGINTYAKAYASHAEGKGTLAFQNYSHAEGEGCKATEYYAHAEGNKTIASGKASHAGGVYTKATAYAQTAIGKYNAENAKALLIVGNGASDTNRSNAFEVISDTSGASIKIGSTILTEAQLGKLLKLISDT